MWKYLKDLVIGRLISKWIIEAEPLSIDLNSPYFQYYKNIKLDPDSKLSDDYKIVEGSAEELSVEVDWMELLKYWTEIKSKYHIEPDEDEYANEEVLISDKRCSEVKIKNLNLHINTQSKMKSEIQISPAEPDVDVNLLKDFSDHVVSQFKVKIDGITLIINDQITLNCTETITIHPEINGIRRIQLPDIRITAAATGMRVKKGSEILITRTIEGFKVKVQVPEIDIDLEDIEDIEDIMNIGKPSDSKSQKQYVWFEVSCDLIILKYREIKVIINDIYFNESGEFITGHFNIKWRGSMLLNSPIQTQVIRGNFRKSRMEIDDELEITADKFVIIEELMKLRYKGNDNHSSNNYNINMKLKVLNIRIEGYQVLINELSVIGNSITVKAIDLMRRNSQLKLQDITFIKSESDTIIENNVSLSPFAELKRFIENDEIISLEKKETLYYLFNNSNRLNIRKAIGKLYISDIPDIPKSTSKNTSTSNYMSVIGIVKDLDLKIILTESCDTGTVYELQLSSFEFLKASDSFFNFNSNFNCLMRDDMILLVNPKVNCTITSRESVVEIDGLEAIVPYNLVDLLTLDIGNYFDKTTEPSSRSNDIQVVMKNFSFDVKGPELMEPNNVKSQFSIKEVTVKMAKSTAIYVDDFQVVLDDFPVFKSGLLKVTIEPGLSIRNHCSHVTLTPESFEKLKRFVKYWSDIYSPIIQEIAPEAVYIDEGATVTGADNANTATAIVDEEDNLELELDIFYEDEIQALSYTEKELKLYEPVQESHQDLKELLNEIDEDFFVNRKTVTTAMFTRRVIEIIDFGIEINLILPENEFKFSLKGIDGAISSDLIEFKVKSGSLVESKKSSVILGRWQKGPDVTCKYPIEDANFLRIQAEKILKNQTERGIDEFNLIISICPLRLFLDQKSMNSLCKFGRAGSDDIGTTQSEGMRGFIFFNKVNISALALKLDYNPNATSTLNSPAIPLQGAEMILPRIELRGIKGIEGLGPAILSTWIPELKGSKLTGVLKTGLMPVRTVVNLGGGMVELILLPWQLGSREISGNNVGGGSAAQTVAHIRRSSKQIGLETLKLTTSLANQTSKLLGSSSTNKDYPKDFQSGVQQAAQLIIAIPTRIHQQSQQKSALRAVPLLILDSAAMATGALAKTLQGIQAEFDSETGIERKLKQQQRK